MILNMRKPPVARGNGGFTLLFSTNLSFLFWGGEVDQLGVDGTVAVGGDFGFYLIQPGG